MSFLFCYWAYSLNFISVIVFFYSKISIWLCFNSPISQLRVPLFARFKNVNFCFLKVIRAALKSDKLSGNSVSCKSVIVFFFPLRFYDYLVCSSRNRILTNFELGPGHFENYVMGLWNFKKSYGDCIFIYLFFKSSIIVMFRPHILIHFLWAMFLKSVPFSKAF